MTVHPAAPAALSTQDLVMLDRFRQVRRAANFLAFRDDPLTCRRLGFVRWLVWTGRVNEARL